LKLITDDISKYYVSLDDTREDGYTAIKVTSLSQFYKLRGRTVNIVKENMEPILYVLYVIFSQQEGKYYLRSFRNIPLMDLFFYEQRWPKREDIVIESLRRYVYDSNVFLLLSDKQVEDIKAILARVSKFNLNTGKLIRYLDFVRLCDLSLQREWFEEYKKSYDGYKTQLSIYDRRITEIWTNVK
jgi:hypothetical protein